MSQPDLVKLREEHDKFVIGQRLHVLLESVVRSSLHHRAVYSDLGVQEDLFHAWVSEDLLVKGKLGALLSCAESSGHLRALLTRSFSRFLVDRAADTPERRLHKRVISVLHEEGAFRNLGPPGPHGLWTSENNPHEEVSRLDRRALRLRLLDLTDEELKIERYEVQAGKRSALLRHRQLLRFLACLLDRAEGALTASRIMDAVADRFIITLLPSAAEEVFEEPAFAGAEPPVLLSFAGADNAVALRVASGLRDAGVPVMLDVLELAAEASPSTRMLEASASAAFLVILLSPQSASVRWLSDERSAATLVRDVKDRALALVPALIDDCEISPELARYGHFDLRGDLDAGVATLASRLNTARTIDFGALDPIAFEHLIADLLETQGYAVHRRRGHTDWGFAFSVSSEPHAHQRRPRATDTLLDLRFYRDERVSVSWLREGHKHISSKSGNGLIVTNSQLTSVARDFLTELNESASRELRVIDRSELAALLMQQPEIVERYFALADQRT